jgi:hypothetical protein
MTNFTTGWKVINGKFVKKPPEKISSCSSEVFSVSGRTGSKVFPKGRLFYVSNDMNLQVTTKHESKYKAAIIPSISQLNVLLFKPGKPANNSKYLVTGERQLQP